MCVCLTGGERAQAGGGLNSDTLPDPREEICSTLDKRTRTSWRDCVQLMFHMLSESDSVLLSKTCEIKAVDIMIRSLQEY